MNDLYEFTWTVDVLLPGDRFVGIAHEMNKAGASDGTKPITVPANLSPTVVDIPKALLPLARKHGVRISANATEWDQPMPMNRRTGQSVRIEETAAISDTAELQPVKEDGRSSVRSANLHRTRNGKIEIRVKVSDTDAESGIVVVHEGSAWYEGRGTAVFSYIAGSITATATALIALYAAFTYHCSPS